MDVQIRETAERQGGYVGWWQLTDRGWPDVSIWRAVERGRMVVVRDGVLAVGHVPTDPRARYWAAVLTTPTTALSHHSAACFHGFRRDFSSFETVVRPGCGGPRTIDGLLVSRSRTLGGEIVLVDGLPVTRAARTIIDLAPASSDKALGKLVREAIRVGAMTPYDLHAALLKHRGRRGVARVRLLCEQYARLQIGRTKSDAEALAVVLLDLHQRKTPLVNVVVAGFEADLVWRQERLIIEIDGPQWHLFAEEDARRTVAWRGAGFHVVRLPSDDVFDHPERLLAPAPRAERPGAFT